MSEVLQICQSSSLLFHQKMYIFGPTPTPRVSRGSPAAIFFMFHVMYRLPKERDPPNLSMFELFAVEQGPRSSEFVNPACLPNRLVLYSRSDSLFGFLWLPCNFLLSFTEGYFSFFYLFFFHVFYALVSFAKKRLYAWDWRDSPFHSKWGGVQETHGGNICKN